MLSASEPAGSLKGQYKEIRMTQTRDWEGMRSMSARLLAERTGEGVDAWNRRIREKHFTDDQSLRVWLTEQGVTGYAQSLLVMERFGYPDFLLASADELIEAQYADRPHLRPIYEAIVAAARNVGEIVVQARKGYVSLLTPRRTFARVQATTKNRVDLGLRIDGENPGGRLQPSSHETMKLQISFTTLREVDAEAMGWLKKAYDQNRKP
jgi:Domain of unknown function (DUF5655)